jgi:hypothetical protein
MPTSKLTKIEIDLLPVLEFKALLEGFSSQPNGLFYDEAGQVVGRKSDFVFNSHLDYLRSIEVTSELTINEDLDEDDAEDQTQAGRLIRIITESDCKLFHDTLGNSMVAVNGDGSRILRISSKEFRSWLANAWWKKYRKGISNSIIDTAAVTIDGMAMHDGEEIQLHTRVASLENDWYYDLGDGRVVKITNDEWLVLEKPPILFYRFTHQKPQADPVKGGDFQDIFSVMLHPEDENEKLLLTLWLMASFMPEIYHPILLVHGEQGSRKTTLFKMLRSLIDPSVLETISVRKDIAEFVQQASHHYFLPLDNLSEVKPDLSDLLCRLVTGEGFSKRELFTNDNDVIYSFQRVVGLNGINLIADKPDLLDRSIIIKLTPPEKYVDERVIFEQLSQIRPMLLGAIFDIMVKTKAELGNILDTEELASYRMAGFAKQSLAIARAFGFADQQVFAALKYNRDMQHGHVQESSLLLQLITKHMTDVPQWEGSANELVDVLKELAIADSVDLKGVPTAVRIKRKITEIIPTLRAQGIDFSERRGASRIIGFTNRNMVKSLDDKAFSFDEIAAAFAVDTATNVDSDGFDSKILTSQQQ